MNQNLVSLLKHLFGDQRLISNIDPKTGEEYFTLADEKSTEGISTDEYIDLVGKDIEKETAQ